MKIVFSGSYGDPCPDFRPLRGLDAAREGEDLGGKREGANQERHQLRASVPGKLIKKNVQTCFAKIGEYSHNTRK